MKNTVFFEVLSKWQRLSEKEKVKLLQRFEEENAKFAQRQAREIILDSKGKVVGNGAYGVYCRTEPSYLFLSPQALKGSAVGAMDTTTHEGFHAWIDDYFVKNTDLRTFSHVDKNKLHFDREYMNLLYNRASFEGLLALFSLMYYEEEVVGFETCLYLIYNLLNTCENMSDCELLLQIYYYDILGVRFSRDQYAKAIQSQSKLSFDQIRNIVLAIDERSFADHKIPITTTAKLGRWNKPNVLRNFDDNFKLFVESQVNVRDDARVRKCVQQMLLNNARDIENI